MIKHLVEGVRNKVECASETRLQLMKFGAGILLHHGKAMSDKAGLVEMGVGLEDNSQQRKQRESCRWRQMNLSAENNARGSLRELGVRGWVVDEDEETEREHQRRQRRRRSQV